ncbi:YqhG family protein [Gracilibacillus xinjiangensis]|uniref:YqhG family protein n=1 Tax=Gracilibacillus xinjiangensis TaxID=1193282 RepID=A0ABV8X1D3_9BACI
MKIDNLHSFLHQFFSISGCKVSEPEANELVVQLTKELDITLMNRPFYWHYMDKIGQQGTPMSLQLSTGGSQIDPKKEWIHYGSPRLHQIFQYIQSQAEITLLYEALNIKEKTALFPWLVANLKIEYIGKQKKEEIHSIGLHLINGTMINHMMTILENVDLKEIVSDYSYTITPIITPSSGFQRIFNYLEQELAKKDYSWASQAMKALEEELNLLEHFFSDQENDRELYDNEVVRLKERLEPRIKMNIINAGIFYLSEQTMSKILY